MNNWAILDNSSFAGVMRCYAPTNGAHQKFLENYPQHKVVDQYSLADFLTAICAFDDILLEDSSKVESFSSADVQPIKAVSNLGWVEQLVDVLQPELKRIICAAPLTSGETWGEYMEAEDRAQRLAFNIFCSPLRDRIRLSESEKLPEVYTSPSYRYRQDFFNRNAKAGNPLEESLLTQAMFLHRGLYLQLYAQKNSATYMPYLYRGKMLSSLPPLIHSYPDAHLPLLSDLRATEADPLRTLSKHYFSLLEKVTWAGYDEHIPFIGASILAGAGGSVQKSIDTALEVRERGEILSTFRELRNAVTTQDRVLYDIAVDEVKDSLTKASIALGSKSQDSSVGKFYKLASFWIPSELKDAASALAEILPARVKRRINQPLNSLIWPNSYQLLFLRHVGAIRA